MSPVEAPPADERPAADVPRSAHQLAGSDPKSQRWSLLAELNRLGGELAESELPSPASLREVVAGLVHYLASGSLEAPATPDDAAGETLSPRDAELAAAQQRIAELEAQGQEQPAPAVEPGQEPPQ